MSDWPTKDKDLTVAHNIISRYAKAKDISAVGLVEVVVNIEQKSMNLNLASWIRDLAKCYYQEYGFETGEVVMRNVLANYIVNGETVH